MPVHGETSGSVAERKIWLTSKYMTTTWLICFHTFTAVSLPDPVPKLLQAGEQRGTALREEDGCPLRLPADAV